jgi:DNA-binding MurR/RpiR family transcriptional regulator
MEMLVDRLLDEIGSPDPDAANAVIARYFARHLQDIHDVNIHVMAKECSVSPASISRFVQRLGYDSFIEMKEAAEEENRLRALPQFQFHPKGEMPLHPGEGLGEVHDRMQEWAGELAGVILPETAAEIQQMAEDMLSSACIHLYCSHYNRAMADHIQAELFGRGVVCEIYSGVHPKISTVRSESTAVILSMNGFWIAQERSLQEYLQQRYAHIWIVTQKTDVQMPGASFVRLGEAETSVVNYLGWSLTAEQIIYACQQSFK